MDKKKEIDMTLVNLTRHKIRQEEQKKGKHLTKKQRRKIMFYTSIGLYIFSGVLGGKAALALNEARENAIENSRTDVMVDATDKDIIVVDNVDFKSSLLVSVNKHSISPNEITINENISKSVDELVDNVEGPNDVLDIVKKLYVEEYNKTHEGKNIDINCIKLHSTRIIYGAERKKAKNGDNIYTLSQNNQYGEEILSATLYDRDINDEDAQMLHREYITRDGKDFVTVYDENDEVEKYEDNILAKMGDVLYTAIHYSSYIELNGMDSSGFKGKYEDLFKQALMKYKQKEIEQESIQYLADDGEMEK